RDLKLKSESKITPRLVTSDLIKGVNFPRLLNSISLFVLGPTSRISVLSSFNFKKLLLIHLFIAKSNGSNGVYCCSIIWLIRDVQLRVISITMETYIVFSNDVPKWQHVQ